MKLRDLLLYKFFPVLAKGIIDLIRVTSRTTVVSRRYYEEQRQKNHGVIFAVWHANLVPGVYLYHSSLGGKQMLAMVSRSADGEVISRVLQKFGAQTVRGSSSRGGSTGLLQMTERMKEGKDGVFTVDGPRGPANQVQPGVVKLAQLSGAAILPCGVSVRPCLRLKSWDRFKIPLPFNRTVLVLGNPIRVSGNANNNELEDWRRLVEESLIACTGEAKRAIRRK